MGQFVEVVFSRERLLAGVSTPVLQLLPKPQQNCGFGSRTAGADPPGAQHAVLPGAGDLEAGDSGILETGRPSSPSKLISSALIPAAVFSRCTRSLHCWRYSLTPQALHRVPLPVARVHAGWGLLLRSTGCRALGCWHTTVQAEALSQYMRQNSKMLPAISQVFTVNRVSAPHRCVH